MRASGFIAVCLLAALPGLLRAEIVVDGRLNESEWTEAQVCSEWVRTQPYLLDTPRLESEARLVSTPEGLAVGFHLAQPPGEPRTKPRTPRDASDFHGDSVTLIVDFDADGQVGFEFSVALGEGVRDGLVTNRNEYSADWDGAWRQAVLENDDGWYVEILVPWSTASMRAAAGGERTIAAFFERTLYATNERYACPGANADRPQFLREFRHFRIADQRARQLDVVPYATFISDQLADDAQFKAGADLFWKPSGDFQLVATVNPDFGQVESDELVINFSAIETVFTDKRPFFTENQGAFDLRTPGNGQLIYTRRVGALADDGSKAADIDGALKLNGSIGAVSYGAFVAQEDDYSAEVGRRFAATRLSVPWRVVRLGHMATWADRPYFDRTALLNAVDFELRPEGRWRWSGQLIRSDLDELQASMAGYEAWLQTDFAQTPVLSHSLQLLQIDDRFDMNDLGYLERNDLRRAEWTTHFSRGGFAEDDRVQGVSYQLGLEYRETTDGLRLPMYTTLIRETQYLSGWQGHWEMSYDAPGTDDTLSRGNGNVRLPTQGFLYGRYVTPRWGAWQHAVAGHVFYEGVRRPGVELELTHSWYPRDGLVFNLTMYPRLARDWLLWSNDNLFGSYEARRLDVYARIDWLPRAGHELRVKLQWIGIDAHPVAAWRTDAAGRLQPAADPVAPFTLNNLGIQVRYRYQLGPLSDLYLVYSRGGFQYREEDDRDLRDLFGDLGRVRDADQFLLKIRYRL